MSFGVYMAFIALNNTDRKLTLRVGGCVGILVGGGPQIPPGGTADSSHVILSIQS